jgi:2-C-methyl-D-erythritol 4-phosphate cytidylyltransferase
MKISVIVVAAGSSTRLKGRVHKPYRLINGKPMLLHSILTFSRIPSANQIIIAIHPDDQKRINRLLASRIVYRVSRITTVHGGPSRSHSVYNALQAVDKDSKIVLIHDAARPFITKPDIIKLISMVGRKGAAILARSVTDTIKQVTLKSAICNQQSAIAIARTISRNTLWAAQTPQGFRKDIIIRAYNLRKRRLADYTDDAGVVESTGQPVYIVEGSAGNIKITTESDIKNIRNR